MKRFLMIQLKKAAILILLLAALTAPNAGQQKGIVKGELGERLDDRLIAFAKEGFSGAVLVAQNDRIVLHKAYGLADRERGVANKPETLFNVASVGKIFTAAAVLKLEMRGKLKTSDPLGKYLGEFPGVKAGATIHHLLTHTGGLVPDGAPLKYESRAEFVRSVKEAPAESRPGENYRYSNAGYVLLAAVVEVVSGMPFETYLRKNIFAPAGLDSAGYPWEPRFAGAPLAVGYQGDVLESLQPAPAAANVWGNRGPGNLVTNVGDLHKWVKALRDDKVLSPAARKKMFTAHANGDEGYGWHIRKTPRHTTLVRRGGGRPDFESELQWYPDENTVLIFAVNNDLNFRHRVAPALEKIIWPGPTAATAPNE